VGSGPQEEEGGGSFSNRRKKKGRTEAIGGKKEGESAHSVQSREEGALGHKSGNLRETDTNGRKRGVMKRKGRGLITKYSICKGELQGG